MSKKIIGLDLGVTSIGWALVTEAETDNEKSEIVKVGVRVVPLTTDEESNFGKGQAITTNQDRTDKRGARRNLQRYKLRRQALVKALREIGLIDDRTILSEAGTGTTFQTLALRAKAPVERLEKDELARVFLAINKKRGYKSNRKTKGDEEETGQLIDGMKVAKMLFERQITPGQYVLELLQQEKKYLSDFYRSDLLSEFDNVWECQRKFYPKLLTNSFKAEITGKGQRATAASFWNRYQFNTAENKGSRLEKKLQAYKWRVLALSEQLEKEEVAYVLAEINNDLNKSSGYLGSISDRSKELYFNNQTVGQYLFEQVLRNPHTRLKGQVFYRQDYEDEFDAIWAEQSKHYPELTDDLKKDLKDVIIFYQRRLKSQKGLIAICELEGREVQIIQDGKEKVKLVGPRACPKSSPLFQEFRIWQRLNDIEVRSIDERTKWRLEQPQKEKLFNELNLKRKLSANEVLKLLYEDYQHLELNFKEIIGNQTNSALCDAYAMIAEASGHGEYDFSKMNAESITELLVGVFDTLNVNTKILDFNTDLVGKALYAQPSYEIWHLLYSYEGDGSATGNQALLKRLNEKFGFSEEYARILCGVAFEEDYGDLSAKAISKILPHLKRGVPYAGDKRHPDKPSACRLAGYRHSKTSMTKEELTNRALQEKIELLPKNSLRNPVVEKILNHTINVVNAIIDEYGKPDEIRIELARELKKSKKEREEATASINAANREHQKIRETLKKDFGLSYVSRNDIVRYKLYDELRSKGYKTLYSDTYVSPEKLFSKEFDIEHIIPQARLFDDSFSNKTLELRDVNIKKGDRTALDFVQEEYGSERAARFRIRVSELYKLGRENGGISKAKRDKLLMSEKDIPDGFVERDLRNSQYIAKKAKELLMKVCRTVVATTGSVTSRLREDWQLVNVLKELNWTKYDKQGLTFYDVNRHGHPLPKIKDWTKRNDHRHHAMDAITVAFTKPSHVQYLNYLNARKDQNHQQAGSIYAIENKELYKINGSTLFKPPMPLDEFRRQAKKALENTLISFKAKNKVVTPSKNKTKNCVIPQNTLTPRGALHKETVYGSIQQYETAEIKVGGGFDRNTILKVAKNKFREALLKRLDEFEGDPRKAFTGRNSLAKNPVYLNEFHSEKLPDKVKLVELKTVYTTRKDVNPKNFKTDRHLEKVIDPKIREILKRRKQESGGDPKKAFSNLNENPIWLNRQKGIALKRVTIKGISNPEAIHEKKDKNGKLILGSDGKTLPNDFVSTGNNHHVAIYRDANGALQEQVVSFFEAVARQNIGLPVIDKTFKHNEGWQFVFSLKQNEMFVFPNNDTGFAPQETDLMAETNYHLISPNLFRVQKMASFSTGGIMFRHHLETNVDVIKELQGIAYISIRSVRNLEGIAKVRINHLGKIVQVGEY